MSGCYECAWGKVCGCWRCGSRQPLFKDVEMIFDVYCNGRWMTAERALSAAGAISIAQEGLGSDNAVWAAQEVA